MPDIDIASALEYTPPASPGGASTAALWGKYKGLAPGGGVGSDITFTTEFDTNAATVYAADVGDGVTEPHILAPGFGHYYGVTGYAALLLNGAGTGGLVSIFAVSTDGAGSTQPAGVDGGASLYIPAAQAGTLWLPLSISAGHITSVAYPYIRFQLTANGGAAVTSLTADITIQQFV
jgi:hypothetical protein